MIRTKEATESIYKINLLVSIIINYLCCSFDRDNVQESPK